MRRIASVLIVGGAVLLIGAGIASAATTVDAEDFDFSPKTISIDPGGSITFENTVYNGADQTKTSIAGTAWVLTDARGTGAAWTAVKGKA